MKIIDFVTREILFNGDNTKDSNETIAEEIDKYTNWLSSREGMSLEKEYRKCC